jgi:hypothetical protein
MKLLELLHFYLTWAELSRDNFTPPNVMGHTGRSFADSLRTACMAWWATVVDTTPGGLNVFEVWRILFPKHRREIDTVWNKIQPEWNPIKAFRDKVAFHADTPLNYFKARQVVMSNKQTIRALRTFLDLSVKLIKAEAEELPDFADSTEDLLLDLELRLNCTINRRWFKEALILPKEPRYLKKFN